MINQFYRETKMWLESIAGGALQSANCYAIFPRETLAGQLLNEIKALGGFELSYRLPRQIKDQSEIEDNSLSDSGVLSSAIKLSTFLFVDMRFVLSNRSLGLMAEKYAMVASYYKKSLILVFDDCKGNLSVDSEIETLESLPVKFEIIKTQGRFASDGLWLD